MPITDNLHKRLQYFLRVFHSYVLSQNSQLTFWHGVPEPNTNIDREKLGPYYMLFRKKADYQGAFDANGIPQLDYHGQIGIQYNPIAIAQYGLGNFNLFLEHQDSIYFERFMDVADWLVDNLEKNEQGLDVWMHNFDFEYRDRLEAPWYSGLAQGQGVSVLVRAHDLTNKGEYLDAARVAYRAFKKTIDEGGVIFRENDQFIWIEEYIVRPPTHILNGLIWALWGVYDYYLATGFQHPRDLFDRIIHTLIHNIDRYDIGYWSLYELAGTRLKMVASPFYHALHIVQLSMLYELTGENCFRKYAKKWSDYNENIFYRWRALLEKIVFKIIYY